MINIFYITLGIFGYIIFGYILKKLNIFSKIKFENFSFLSFNILLPIALITNFWEIEFPNIVVYELVIVFFGSGIIVYFTAFIITKVFYKSEAHGLFAWRDDKRCRKRSSGSFKSGRDI